MNKVRFGACITALATAISCSALAVPSAAATAATTATYVHPGVVGIGQSAGVTGGGAVSIDDLSTAAPYPSPATIGGLVGSITDVNLTLVGLDHTWPDDVDVLLVSPAGKQTVVMSDSGGASPATALNITLDDQAGQGLPDETALTSGSYRPTDHEAGDVFPAPAPGASSASSALSVFNDSNPNGTWHLFVVDDDVSDMGSLLGWRLEVQTTGPHPYPAPLTISGAANVLTDVNVILDGFSHTSPSDVDVLLVSPSGRQATVLSDVGSDADVASARVTLDDEAAISVPTPIASGRYRPTNAGGGDPFPAPAPTASGTSSLAAFDGVDPNGTWQLFVTDDAAGDVGALAGGWALEITTVDTIRPQVSRWVPASGKQSVRRGANLHVTFTENMRRASLSKKSVFLIHQGTSDRVPARLRYDDRAYRLTLDPRGVLLADTKYRVVVTTRVKDESGNRLDQKSAAAGLQGMSWRFRTR